MKGGCWENNEGKPNTSLPAAYLPPISWWPQSSFWLDSTICRGWCVKVSDDLAPHDHELHQSQRPISMLTLLCAGTSIFAGNRQWPALSSATPKSWWSHCRTGLDSITCRWHRVWYETGCSDCSTGTELWASFKYLRQNAVQCCCCWGCIDVGHTHDLLQLQSHDENGVVQTRCRVMASSML